MQLEDIFPYESFRQGQRDVAVATYDACIKSKRLAIEAMSGFGKTIAVLTGSILAAEEGGLRIIYACRTKRQVLRTLEEMQKVQQRFPFSAAYLFAKNDYCLLKERSPFRISEETFKWFCSFNVSNNLCSYFLNTSILGSKLTKLARDISDSVLPHSKLMNKCTELHVCPYEVARLSLGDAKLVITTYHYLIHPTARSILFGDAILPSRKPVAIIDEAHNIRDFLRDSSTYVLPMSVLKRAIEDAKGLYIDAVKEHLEKLAEKINAFCLKHESWYLNKRDFIEFIRGPNVETWLPDLAFELLTCTRVAWYSISGGRNLPSSILTVGDFLTNLLGHVDACEWMLVKSGNSLYLTHVDAAKDFAEATRELKALVLISATISPSEIFLKSLGLTNDIILHKTDASFSFSVRTLVDTSVSTRFKLRTKDTYAQLAAKIAAACEFTDAGIAVFASSYIVLESLTAVTASLVRNRRLLTEHKQMTNDEAEAMMQAFKSEPKSLLMAVQGGRFSEGEDFPGDQMDTSIVVGLSLPPPSPLLYAEYMRIAKEKRHDAYLEISLLPALRKAFQSAGRHIRNPGKTGMVILLDTRFSDREVISMMPYWLKRDLIIGDFKPHDIEKMTTDFFNTRHPCSS